ncbi:hypothetical protein COCNU_04G009780 [Cocos nucifera]|uniref:Uncharacterized protein n=1 Tax=Cocos nucifera TaxID=13894 RepID=A0A8K0I710_COCNU|nr:hypothetical protein COCNU_04G009780 [Cocos nucifera]
MAAGGGTEHGRCRTEAWRSVVEWIVMGVLMPIMVVMIWIMVLVRCYQRFGGEHLGVFYGMLGEMIAVALLLLAVVVCACYRKSE